MKYSLKELDNLILNTEKNVPLLENIRPVNLEDEKQRFFDEKYNYNPQFKYKTTDYSDTLKKLERIEIKDSANSKIMKLYQDKIEYLKQKITIQDHIGTNPESFTKASQSMFGQPDSKLTDTARTVIEKDKEMHVKPNYLEFDEIIDLIKEFLNRYKLNTKINIINSQFNKLEVDHFKNIIYVPKNTRRSKSSIIGALYHEIGTHLLRAKNGKKQEFGIFFNATADYLPTEEGLATIMGHFHKENKLMARSAKLLLCVHHSLTNDFKTTFEMLYEIEKKPKTNFNRVLRAKRGIGDTSRGGAFTKDLYFQWGIELGRKLITQPNYLNYIFNGKANYVDLYDLTEKSDQKQMIQKDDIIELFKDNQIKF